MGCIGKLSNLFLDEASGEKSLELLGNRVGVENSMVIFVPLPIKVIFSFFFFLSHSIPIFC
jgi:hypothetical protein